MEYKVVPSYLVSAWHDPVSTQKQFKKIRNRMKHIAGIGLHDRTSSKITQLREAFLFAVAEIQTGLKKSARFCIRIKGRKIKSTVKATVTAVTGWLGSKLRKVFKLTLRITEFITDELGHVKKIIHKKDVEVPVQLADYRFV